MAHNSSIIRINTFATWYFLHLVTRKTICSPTNCHQTPTLSIVTCCVAKHLITGCHAGIMNGYYTSLNMFKSASNTSTLPKNAQATRTRTHTHTLFSWGNHCKLVSWFSFFPVIKSLSFPWFGAIPNFDDHSETNCRNAKFEGTSYITYIISIHINSYFDCVG